MKDIIIRLECALKELDRVRNTMEIAICRGFIREVIRRLKELDK